MGARGMISQGRLPHFFFVRDRIRYRRDPVDVELVQDAQRTIETGAGDCDDKVVALCSLLCVAGYVTRFVSARQVRQPGHKRRHRTRRDNAHQATSSIPTPSNAC